MPQIQIWLNFMGSMAYKVMIFRCSQTMFGKVKEHPHEWEPGLPLFSSVSMFMVS